MLSECEVHGKCVDEDWNDDEGVSHAQCLGPIPEHVKERLRLLHKIDRQRRALRAALDQRAKTERELADLREAVTKLSDELWVDRNTAPDSDAVGVALRHASAQCRALTVRASA